LVRLYDAPGVADLELPLAEIINDIKENIGHTQNFDAAMIVLKMTDYRASI